MLAAIPSESFGGILGSELRSAYVQSFKWLLHQPPNEIHRAIANAAKVGIVANVVTTNFDCCFEKAYEAKMVPFDLVLGADEKRNNEIDSTTARHRLVKIHGDATTEHDFTDSPTSKYGARGPLRTRLMKSLVKKSGPLLVLGFSGRDLEQDANYLGLRDMALAGVQIIWVARPADNISPGVKRLINSAPSTQLFQGEMPECLYQLLEMRKPRSDRFFSHGGAAERGA
jgi:hypothetical protein